MARMIELIRQNAVPANVVRNAARGALSLPTTEVLEILVHLSKHHLFGEQARMTLAGFDEAACLAAVRDPETPAEVLAYLSEPGNLRPSLLPALLDNPSVPLKSIVALCSAASQIMARVLLAHERVQDSLTALEALAKNKRVTPEQAQAAKQLLGVEIKDAEDLAASHAEAAISESPEEPSSPSDEDSAVAQFLAQHARDIAAEENKPFTMIGMSDQEQMALNSTDAATASALRLAKLAEEHGEEKQAESTIQKVARMTVGQRVQLAMKGNKDERAILIRDGARIVSSAVLESPKLTDTEVDNFAALKNVSENVLRVIGGKRKFLKRYSVVRVLVNNPKTPVDMALTLVPRLMVNDLKNLCRNRDVSETVVKLAVKLFRERTSAR